MKTLEYSACGITAEIIPFDSRYEVAYYGIGTKLGNEVGEFNEAERKVREHFLSTMCKEKSRLEVEKSSLLKKLDDLDNALNSKDILGFVSDNTYEGKTLEEKQ